MFGEYLDGIDDQRTECTSTPRLTSTSALEPTKHETGYESFWSYDQNLVADVIEAFSALD